MSGTRNAPDRSFRGSPNGGFGLVERWEDGEGLHERTAGNTYFMENAIHWCLEGKLKQMDPKGTA